MRSVLILLALVAAGFALYVRLAPSDPARWHVDPLAAPDPGPGGIRLAPPEAPVFAASPQAVIEAFDAVALSTPRVTRLAGSPGEGQVTYVARSRLWGFPDYVTIRVLPDPETGGATVAIHSRLRFGQGDMGVNRARVEAWLGAVEDRLAG
ncbi:DUF1499 domain-containing protein [Palleronia sp. KMU-117]|uniref:DUF1499 domain-containing protein n=1 Tax=Palleronia sp. KMU-117 TaxID=3434108 RepID=UPI003D72519C